MAKIDDLSKEIAKALMEYSTEVEKGLEEAKGTIAKETVKELKDTSPRKTGKYAKGWRVKNKGTAKIIHNATRYQLCHLLEYGFPKRKGGRVAARVHIKPAEERAIKKFTNTVESLIKKG